MRVYLGVTLTELATAVAEGGFGSPPLLAHAVTPGLREWFAEGDQEELEYVAMTDAAHDSLRRLSLDADAPPRRVVVAVEAPDTSVAAEPDTGRSVVLVGAALPVTQIASVHVDDEEAEDAVRAAVRAVAKADEGDEDAAFTVDEASGYELLWYARQEIPDLFT